MLLWEKLTFKTADISIATNESYKKIAVARGGMDLDKVHIVRSGPDLTRTKKVPPNSKWENSRKHMVGYVGVMGAQEGLDYLLDGVAVAGCTKTPNPLFSWKCSPDEIPHSIMTHIFVTGTRGISDVPGLVYESGSGAHPCGGSGGRCRPVFWIGSMSDPGGTCWRWPGLFRKRGWTWIQQKYNWETIAEQTVKLYEEALR